MWQTLSFKRFWVDLIWIWNELTIFTLYYITIHTLVIRWPDFVLVCLNDASHLNIINDIKIGVTTKIFTQKKTYQCIRASILGQSLWELSWKMWHWERFTFELFDFPLSVTLLGYSFLTLQKHTSDTRQE